MAIDLLSTLNISGIQKTNPPLYQVMSELIKAVAGNTTTITNVTNNVVSGSLVAPNPPVLTGEIPFFADIFGKILTVSPNLMYVNTSFQLTGVVDDPLIAAPVTGEFVVSIDPQLVKQQIGLGMAHYIVTVAVPAYLFRADVDANFGTRVGAELLTNETIGNAVAYTNALGFIVAAADDPNYPNSFRVYQIGDLGTGAVAGMNLTVDNNNSGSGAAATINLRDLNGVDQYLWVDAAGKLRIGPARPTENGSVSDTSGTVVGTQT